MNKIITIFISVIQCFLVGNSVGVENIGYFLNNVDSINIYANGKMKSLNKDEDFYLVFDELEDILIYSHEMPAFGVALNEEIVKGLKSGLWLELVYDKRYNHNGMPFEKLLINIQKENKGFNLIRFFDNKYDGRCFYIDMIDDDMSELYILLQNII